MTLQEMMKESEEKLNDIRDTNHAVGQSRWYDFIKGQGDFEGNEWEGRDDEEQALLQEMYNTVHKNVFYGTPPYALESVVEIIEDIIADLTILKDRQVYNSAGEV